MIEDLCSGLSYYMKERGIKSVSQLVGKSLPFITTHDDLKQETKVISHIDELTCIHCGACHIACRDGGHQAINFDTTTRIAKTDGQACVGCAFCVTVCPIENCLTMVPEGT